MAKYKAYPEYKNSGVEWLEDVPIHWQQIPCRAAVSHIVDKNYDGKIQNYLSLMASVGVIRYEDKGDVGNKKPDDLSKCKIVKKGQLVINSMNYGIGSYGMSPFDGVCSPVYIILEPRKNFLKRYSLRIFENTLFQKHLATFGNGILEHRAAIKWDDIRGQIIPLPSKDEQSNILKFLDHETARIDNLIGKQQQLIELLKEKRQAVINHAVTKGLNSEVPMKDSGVEWLGEVPKHWLCTKIKHIALLTPKKSDMNYKPSDQCTFIPMEKLKRNSLITDENRFIRDVINGYTYFEDNDLLLAKVTPCFENKNISVARGLANGVGFGSTEIYVLRPTGKVLVKYLLYRLQEDNFMRSATGAMTGAGGLKRVPSDFLLNYPVAIPPKPEMVAIIDYLSEQECRYDLMEKNAMQGVQLLQERRTALISAAVTGKIDVRDWVAPDTSEVEESQEATA